MLAGKALEPGQAPVEWTTAKLHHGVAANEPLAKGRLKIVRTSS
jgi:hypothetical protein